MFLRALHRIKERISLPLTAKGSIEDNPPPKREMDASLFEEMINNGKSNLIDKKSSIFKEHFGFPLWRGIKGEGRGYTLNSSSIAEVVIALTIIALCFGIASMIFIRSMSVTTRFQDIREQTEIQSKIMESFYRDNDSIPLLEVGDLSIKVSNDETSDSLKLVEFLGVDDRMIWKQQIVKK